MARMGFFRSPFKGEPCTQAFCPLTGTGGAESARRTAVAASSQKYTGGLELCRAKIHLKIYLSYVVC